jgi:ABC-type transport system substrate-binding protein
MMENRPPLTAGRLVDEAGLKGRRVGGAVVSKKHANYIVATEPGTTAQDVKQLMAEVVEGVWATAGLRLEPEVVVVDFGAPVMDEDADEDEGELDDKSHQRRSITPSTASGWE